MITTPRKFPTRLLLGALAMTPLLTTVGPATSVPVVRASTAVTLQLVGRMDSTMGLAGSEISAYDATSNRVFVTNGATNKVDVFNLLNPAAPVRLATIALTSFGVTGVQSVAAKNGYVAIAASVDGNNQAPGRVFITDTEGNVDPRAPKGVTVGSLPDSVHISPDGRYVLSANEGEPADYCLENGVLPVTKDPHGSVSIIDLQSKNLAATTIDFSMLNSSADEIRASGARVYGPGATVAQDLEPEYIAISADSTTAFVTLQENNAVAEIDIANRTLRRVMGLGYKDHMLAGMGIDASDQDSAVAIKNRPVKGMYQPDNIHTFEGADGTEYFITANEGDAREYKCLLGGSSTASAQAEDARVASIGVDGVSIPSAVAANSQLGRLGVTRFFPATYTNNGTATTSAGSTDFTSLYTLGGRSMTVWKRPGSEATLSSAQLVADTGDLIEQKIATMLPDNFGADWNTSTGAVNAKDTRSDNKGPEPEGLGFGRAFGRTLAFVGLERIGGVMAFDITEPSSPQYLDYLNTSKFSGVGGANFNTGGSPAGDVSPEGVLFISATDSPNGSPLLLVANELSGTTSVYKIVGTPVAPSAPAAVNANVSASTATVSWRPSLDDGGSKITKYVVTSTPSGAGCVTRAVQCTVKGLKRGIGYRFTVVAVNAIGRSKSVSGQVTTVGLDTTVASSVTTSLSARTVRVAVAVPSTGKKPTKYAVQLRKDGELVVSRLVRVSAGKAVASVQAKDGGTHTLTVVGLFTDGTKRVWNGPNLTIS
jgi:hypothetical protein